MHSDRDFGNPEKMTKQGSYFRNYLFGPRCSGSETLLPNENCYQNLQWSCSLFLLYAWIEVSLPVSSAENSWCIVSNNKVTSQCQKKVTPRPPVQGGHPSTPEADTVVESPNLVQNVQFWPSSCCKTAFMCILLHLRARRKARMSRLRRIIVRRKINDPGPRAALRIAHMHTLHSGHSGGAVCWRLFSLSPLSPLPSFSFLSLLSPPLSVLFSKTDFGKRAPGKQPQMVWRAPRVNLRAMGACEASLLSSEACKLVFWWGQNAKTNKIYCSSKTKNFWKDTLSVFKDTFYDMIDNWCQQIGIDSCTAEVWPTSSF